MSCDEAAHTYIRLLNARADAVKELCDAANRCLGDVYSLRKPVPGVNDMLALSDRQDECEDWRRKATTPFSTIGELLAYTETEALHFNRSTA